MIHPKVVAATAGVPFGSSVASIALWLLALAHVVPPFDVQQAIITVITTLVTFALGYFTPSASAVSVEKGS